MKKITRKEIGSVCGEHALALCGFAPFGDCQSIRHRLDMARAKVKQLTSNANELQRCIPGDEYVAIFRREAAIWAYAIGKGEKLLKKELLNPGTR